MAAKMAKAGVNGRGCRGYQKPVSLAYGVMKVLRSISCINEEICGGVKINEGEAVGIRNQ
jgi:hypothetical protein